jgi:hypothetical protein
MAGAAQHCGAMTTTNTIRRRAAAFGGTVAALVLLAPAAHADIRNCRDFGFEGSDDNARCSRITGIDPGSSLRVHARPFLGSPTVDRLRGGDVIEIDCWANGDNVNGDGVWVGIYGGSGATFVPDYYVETGDPSVWTRGFARCP